MLCDDAALLIIDVQCGFMNAATAAIPQAAEELQNRYQTVFATRFINPESSNYRRLLGWNRFSASTDEIELAFTPAPHVRVIDKNIYSCVDEGFLKALQAKSLSKVHLCGMDTDICVTKCAVDVFEEGLTPYVLADFCASHAGPEAHERGLKTLARFIGKNQIVSERQMP